MRTHIFAAHFYAHAYTHRAKQVIKKTTHTVKEEVTSDNMKDLAIATAALGTIYLVARVAGFKAGYEFANNE
jgi:hypothetical protein